MATCPVDFTSSPITLQDCDTDIILVSPTHDFQEGVFMRFVSNMTGRIANKISDKTKLELDMGAGVDVRIGFEVRPGGVVEIYTDGCPE